MLLSMYTLTSLNAFKPCTADIKSSTNAASWKNSPRLKQYAKSWSLKERPTRNEPRVGAEPFGVHLSPQDSRPAPSPAHHHSATADHQQTVYSNCPPPPFCTLPLVKDRCLDLVLWGPGLQPLQRHNCWADVSMVVKG